MGLRDELLATNGKHLEPIQVFGHDLFIRRMGGAELDAYEESRVTYRLDETGQVKDASLNMRNLRARLAVLVLADAEGRRIFRDEDAEELGKKDCTELQKIYEAGVRFNKLGRNAVEEAKADFHGTQTERCGSS